MILLLECQELQHLSLYTNGHTAFCHSDLSVFNEVLQCLGAHCACVLLTLHYPVMLFLTERHEFPSIICGRKLVSTDVFISSFADPLVLTFCSK